MAKNVVRILTDREIQKASKLLGYEEAVLTQMNSQYLLDVDYIRTLLVKSDYDHLVRGLQYLVDQKGTYSYPEIMAVLKKEYGMSYDELNAAIHGRKNKTIYFCRKCGIRITKVTYNRTDGLCNNCFAETINLFR